MTMLELYIYLLNEYGKRFSWISDIQKQLNISRKAANHLTYVMGYRRGKAASITPYSVFSMDHGVKLIQAKLVN